MILPGGQVGALEIIERFLGHISLRLHHIDLAIDRVLVGTLSARGALLQPINLPIRVGQLGLNVFHVSISRLCSLKRLFLVSDIRGGCTFLLFLFGNFLSGVYLSVGNFLLFSCRLIRRYRLGNRALFGTLLSIRHIALALMNGVRRLLLLCCRYNRPTRRRLAPQTSSGSFSLQYSPCVLATFWCSHRCECPGCIECVAFGNASSAHWGGGKSNWCAAMEGRPVTFPKMGWPMAFRLSVAAKCRRSYLVRASWRTTTGQPVC